MKTQLMCLGTIVCLLSACEMGTDDGLGSTEQETRVDPKGKENFTTGTLVVSVPQGAPPLAPTTLILASPGAGAAATSPKGRLGEVITAPVGTYDLLVDRATKPFATVVIQGGKQVSLTLPVLAPIPFKEAPKPKDYEPMRFEFGPTVSPDHPSPLHLGLSLTPSELEYYPAEGLIDQRIGLLLAPGTSYHIERLVLGEDDRKSDILATLDVPKKAAAVHAFPVVSDGWKMLSFDVPTAELALSIAGSEFPATAVSLTWDCHKMWDTSHLDAWSGKNTVVAVGVASKKTVAGKYFADHHCEYRLEGLASGSIAIDVAKPKTSIAVGYVDVADVEITHENGSKRTVKGTFTLSRILGPGQPPVALSGSWSTGNAVPLAAGTYAVLVQYQDNNGANSYTETVTVP